MPAKQETFKAVLIKHGHYKEELSVTGDVTEPTTGWTVKLERAQPQGINPRILLLKLVEQAPTGIAGDVVTCPYRLCYPNVLMMKTAEPRD